jgi:hypothetical protein
MTNNKDPKAAANTKQDSSEGAVLAVTLAYLLKAFFTVTNSSYSSGHAGAIGIENGSLIVSPDKLVTNGDPSVHALPGPTGLFAQYNYSTTNPLPIIIATPGATAAAAWTTASHNLTEMVNVYGALLIGDFLFGINYDTSTVVKYDTSDPAGWTLVASYTYSDPQLESHGVGLCQLGNGVIAAVFLVAANPWAPDPDDAGYVSGRVVFLDPVAASGLPVIPVYLDGSQTTVDSVPVGKNPTGLVPVPGTISGTWDIFVPCIGGAQRTDEGNGAQSRLDRINVTSIGSGPKTITALFRTPVIGDALSPSSANYDIRQLAVTSTGRAFILQGNVKGYDTTNYKQQMVWKIRETTVGVLRALPNPTSVSTVGTLRLQTTNAQNPGYDNGYLWDIACDNANVWLWMAHGDSILIYDLSAASPWAAPAYSFPHSALNPTAADGNLNSIALTLESATAAVQHVLLHGVAHAAVASGSTTWREFVRGKLALAEKKTE